jgi:uncharacterized protein YbaR (Trm112 family)
VTVQLDQRLLDVLACPCPEHAPLRVGTQADADSAGTDVLTCTSCGRMFPVRDGIPVLLLDEAVLPESDPGSDRPSGGTSRGR